MAKRGRNRRQRDQSLAPQWPSVAVAVMDVIPGGGSTIVRLEFNVAMRITDTPTLAGLTGWKLIGTVAGGGSEILQAQSLTYLDEGVQGSRVELLFDEELDPVYSHRLIIPGNTPLAQSNTGRPIGGWYDAEGVATGPNAAGWVVISEGGIDTLPGLAYPILYEITGANEVTLGITDIPGAWDTVTNGTIKMDGANALTTDASNPNVIVLTYAAVPTVGAVLSFTAWQTAFIGSSGERLAPFSAAIPAP